MEDRQVQHIFESNATSAAGLVLDLSVLHSYLNHININNKTLTPNPKSGCNGNAFPTNFLFFLIGQSWAFSAFSEIIEP